MVEGWGTLAFGTLSALFFLACGLDTGKRRIVWFVAGGVYLIVWTLYAFYYANYRRASPAQRSKTSKFLAATYVILLLVGFLLAAFVLLFSHEFINLMTNNTREWLYFLALIILCAAPLIPRLDYRPVPVDLKAD